MHFIVLLSVLVSGIQEGSYAAIRIFSLHRQRNCLKAGRIVADQKPLSLPEFKRLVQYLIAKAKSLRNGRAVGNPRQF